MDAVSEVIRIPLNTVELPHQIVSGEESKYVKGVGKLDDRLLMLWDIDGILNQDELEELTTLAES